MTPGQIELIVRRSLLHERTHSKIVAGETVAVDIDLLFQLMVGDAALVFPDADHIAEFDQSPFIFEYMDKLCSNSRIKAAKDFIINVGRLGFDNLHYNLVCKWHIAFSSFEIKNFQLEARNLMTLIR